MFELTLEDLISKTLKSLTANMAKTFLDCIKQENNIESFDKAYSIVESFLKTEYFKFAFDGLPEKTYNHIFYKLKPVSALYCCYFGMDYIYHQKNKDGVPLNSKYLSSYYDCSLKNVQVFMKSIRRQRETIKSTWEYPDPNFVNLYIDAQYADNKKYSPYIYNGNIISYLQKSYSIVNKNQKEEYLINDLVPAITLIALRSTGSLPNGGNTNKSTHVSSNIINSIDHAINEIYYINGKKIPALNTTKIAYKTDQNVAELINLAALDDVYKLERLEKAMRKYNDYITKYKNATLKQEKTIAGMCSLFLNLPLPFINIFDHEFNKALNSIINNETENLEGLINIIGFYTTIFPYVIGLLCFLLFSQYDIAEMSKHLNAWRTLQSLDHIYNILRVDYTALASELKEIENSLAIRPLNEVKITIEKLEIILNKRVMILRQSMFINKGEKIWSYAATEKQNSLTKCIYEDKGNRRTYKHLEWRHSRNLSFSEVLDIILNQKINIAKLRNPLDENYTRHTACEYLIFHTAKFQKFLHNYFQQMGSSEKIPPQEYVNLLTTEFIKSLNL
ncbi:hypothetical protein [Hungatella effluvii]|uniref:hypothetical protein n=1 Tax=Hungatella effluvii TaxID=1096246 RepID=UPI0022DF8520|nr:hypothetical protein [Hungatella effluvii]